MSPSEIYGLRVPESLPRLQEESSGQSSESGILFSLHPACFWRAINMKVSSIPWGLPMPPLCRVTLGKQRPRDAIWMLFKGILLSLAGRHMYESAVFLLPRLN